MAQQAGVDLAQLYEVLTHATGDCVAVRTRLPAEGVVPDSPASNGWAPGFMTDLMAKDLDLAIGYAARKRDPAVHVGHRPPGARCRERGRLRPRGLLRARRRSSGSSPANRRRARPVPARSSRSTSAQRDQGRALARGADSSRSHAIAARRRSTRDPGGPSRTPTSGGRRSSTRAREVPHGARPTRSRPSTRSGSPRHARRSRSSTRRSTPLGPGDPLVGPARRPRRPTALGDAGRVPAPAPASCPTARACAAKLAWVARDTSPTRFARARWILAPRDFVRRAADRAWSRPTRRSRRAPGLCALGGGWLPGARRRVRRAAAADRRRRPASWAS